MSCSIFFYTVFIDLTTTFGTVIVDTKPSIKISFRGILLLITLLNLLIIMIFFIFFLFLTI